MIVRTRWSLRRRDLACAMQFNPASEHCRRKVARQSIVAAGAKSMKHCDACEKSSRGTPGAACVPDRGVTQPHAGLWFGLPGSIVAGVSVRGIL